MFRLFTMFLMFCGMVSAGDQLRDKEQRVEAFKEAEAVVTGKVVYSSVIVYEKGFVVEADAVINVLEQMSKIDADLALLRKTGDETAEELDRLRLYVKEKLAKRDLLQNRLGSFGMRTVICVSIKKVHKGKMERKLMFFSWSEHPLSKCPHVAVDTSIGSEVSAYLKGAWGEGVVNAEHFLMGENVINKPE